MLNDELTKKAEFEKLKKELHKAIEQLKPEMKVKLIYECKPFFCPYCNETHYEIETLGKGNAEFDQLIIQHLTLLLLGVDRQNLWDQSEHN